MYKLVILDLDNTLIDFDVMEHKSLVACFKKHQLPFEQKYLNAYSAINDRLWAGLEKGEYEKKAILTLRFKKWLDHFKLEGNPVLMNEDYLGQMATYAEFIDGAKPLLDYVKDKYKVVMITNGVDKVQQKKIEKTGIRDYFDCIIVSDHVGHHKPSIEIFEYMMRLVGDFKKEEMIILGDSLTSDIQGGINFSIDTCWFNKKKRSTPHHKANYEISHLTEFIEILKKNQNI